MNELTQLIDAFLSKKHKSELLQKKLDKFSNDNKNITKLAVQESSELGETIFPNYKGTGKTVKIGYKTTYVSIGGELKNPAKRRELFERIAESRSDAITDNIVFKDAFMTTEDGKIYESKDAGIDGRYFQKLINSLDAEFREQLIKDGLLGFYSVPVIEVDG